MIQHGNAFRQAQRLGLLLDKSDKDLHLYSIDEKIWCPFISYLKQQKFSGVLVIRNQFNHVIRLPQRPLNAATCLTSLLYFSSHPDKRRSSTMHSGCRGRGCIFSHECKEIRERNAYSRKMRRPLVESEIVQCEIARDRARQDLEVCATGNMRDPKYKGKSASQIRNEAWATINERQRQKTEFEKELKELNSWRHVGDYFDGRGRLADRLRNS